VDTVIDVKFAKSAKAPLESNAAAVLMQMPVDTKWQSRPSLQYTYNLVPGLGRWSEHETGNPEIETANWNLTSDPRYSS